MSLPSFIARWRWNSSPAASVVVVGLFLALALPLIVNTYSRGRAAVDQNTWHLPTIVQFSRELPHPNLRDYPSATTPGYHLALAVASRLVGTMDERALRLMGMSFTIALLLVLSISAACRTSALTAIAICLPVIASPYVFASGVWLLPDNAGWLLVVLGMMLALRRRIDAFFYVGVAVILLALVWVRQTHIWVMAPLLTAAWLGSNDQTPLQPRRNGTIDGIGRIALASLAAVPAVVSLIIFQRLWHGLVPPSQQNLVSGGNAATPAAIFAAFGLVGVFFAGFLPSQAFSRRGAMLAAAGALAGAAVSLIPATTYDFSAGRYSGLWNLALHFPVLFGHSSTFIVALAIVGGAVVATWFAAMPSRTRYICGSALLAFIIAQCANHNAYFRYYEPAVLIAAIFTSIALSPRPPRWALAGPVLLALLLTAVTIATMR